MDNYVIPEKKEECRTYLITEFQNVPLFSNVNTITELEKSILTSHEMKKMESKRIVKEEMLKKLKGSIRKQIIINYDNTTFNDDLNVDIETSFLKIAEYISRIKQKELEVFYYTIVIGGFMKRIKNICEESNLSFKSTIATKAYGYSISTIYFYIQLYDLSIQFPRIQYIVVPIRYIRANWKIFNECINEEAIYWNNVL